MSGSYAYVAAYHSDSLVVVLLDLHSPPPPPRSPPPAAGSIVGSVTSASLLDYVRATRPCASPRAPRRGSLRPHAPQACAPTCPVLIYSGARSLAPSHVLSTQANFVAVSDGDVFQLAGGGRH